MLVAAFAFVYVLVRFRYFADYSALGASQLVPVGVARVLLPAWATWIIAGVALVSAGVFAALGRAGIPLFLSLLWITTYRSAFGKILHSENLLVIHVGILAFVPARGASGRGFVLRLMAVATALTYFVAGVTKLRAGGAAWLDGSALGDWLAYDALRKIELGSFYSPLAAWLASRPPLLAPLALFTLGVELGAPLSLVTTRASRVWAACAWTFHVAILATMAIGFFYPLSGVAFAAVLPLERSSLLRRLSAR